MTFYRFFLIPLLLLTACQDRTADRQGSALTPMPGTPVSRLDREKMIADFNSATCVKINWPADSESNLSRASLLMTGVNSTVPTTIHARFSGKKPFIDQSVDEVYRKSIVRGLDSNLIDVYFSSRMGKTEVQANYVYKLATECGLESSKLRELALEWDKAFANCGPRPAPFVCPSKPDLSETR